VEKAKNKQMENTAVKKEKKRKAAHPLWILTVMQLKDKFSFSLAADKKGAIMKIVSYILGFVLVTGVCYGLIYIFGFLNIFSLGGFVPVSFLTVIFTVMFILSCVSCLSGLTKTLYFSRDNQVLLAFPVQPNIVFLSKINVYFFSEIIKNFLFIVPLFLAYGIRYGFVWYYYIWILLFFILIAALPVVIGALLSLAYMWVHIFLKKYPIINSILIFLILIGFFALAVWLISLLPENINIVGSWGTLYWDIQTFLNGWSKTFLLISYVVTAIVGRGATPFQLVLFNNFTLIYLFSIIGIIAALGVISFLLAKPVFFNMATKPFEFSRKKIPNDYKLKRANFEEKVGKYIFTIKDKTIRTNEKKYREIINKAWKENLFTDKDVSPRRIINILKSISGFEFEYEKITEKTNLKKIGLSFVIIKEHNVNHLVLLKKFNKISFYLFDPIRMTKRNFSAKTPFLSSLYKEFTLSIRVPEIMISNFILFSITPLAIFLLNKIFSAMNTELIGNYMVIAFNVLIILLLFLSSSVNIASVYSREGKSSYLLKSAPINYTKNLLSKLVINSTVILFSVIATGIVFAFLSNQDLLGVWLLFIAVYLIYLGHVLWSAELDFMNPQDKIYAASETSISNPNETKSIIIAFVVSFVFAFLSFFLLQENVEVAAIKLILIGIVFFLIRLYLFITKIKVYNTERGETGK